MIRRLIQSRSTHAHDIHVVASPPEFLAVLILSLSFVALLPNPAFAQWSGDGLLLMGTSSGPGNIDCCADGEGGFWYAQDWYNWTRVVVQHVDSDGYCTFDLSGVSVCDSSDIQLFGVEPGLDGDCIVMFSRPNAQGFMDVYAQRVTQQGERLWGQGINISATDTSTHKTPLSHQNQWTESDSAGGLWGIWGDGLPYHNDINVCGVNADGSLKCSDGDLRIVDWSMDYRAVRHTSDGEGGMTVMYTWNDDDHEYSKRQIYVQRILADGTLRFASPRLVMWWESDLGGYGDPWFIVKDPRGGYIVSAGIRSQRISGGLFEPQWEPTEGVMPYDWINFSQIELSNPVILSDRSMQQLVCGTYTIGNPMPIQPRLGQILFDGTPLHQGDIGPYAGDSMRAAGSGHNNRTIDLPTPDGDSVIYTFIGDPPGGDETPTRTFERVNASGENLWSHVAYLHDPDFGLVIRAFYLDQDNICYLIGNDYLPYAFKLNIHDGSIAGDTGVDEDTETPSSLPDTPAWITSAYPVPFNGTVTLLTQIRVPGTYTVNLFNLLGQQVERRTVTFTTAGVQHLPISAPHGLASGVYFVRLGGSNGILSQRKIVLLR